MQRRIFCILRILIIGLLFVANSNERVVWGQSAGATSAVITGTIKDTQSAVIDGAVVRVKNVATGIVREVTTASGGTFLLPQLMPGDYEITVTAAGFKTQQNIATLAVGATVVYNTQLVIDTVGNETIEVRASAMGAMTRTESSTNIMAGQILNLPINRRSFLDFSLTSARVTPDRVPVQGAAASSGLSFNGQSARFNNITIDGLDNNDLGSGAVRATFSQDAVQEFQVVSDSYSAEFGRALGGVVNIVTRGGGNEYHGGVFSLVRTDETSAKDPFATLEPNFEQYQFGGTVSGPIKSDRAFFFGSFERLSTTQGRIVTISDTVVAAAQASGLGLRNGPIRVTNGTTSILARSDLQLNNNDSLFLRYNFGGRYDSAFEPIGGLVGQTSAGVQELDDHTGAISNVYNNPARNLINETRFLITRRDQDILPISQDPSVQLFAPEGLVRFGRGVFLPQFRQLRTFQLVNTTTLLLRHQQLKFGFDGLVLRDPKGITNVPLSPGGVAVFTPLDLTGLLGIPLTLTGLQAFDPRQRTLQQQTALQALSAALPVVLPGFPALPLANLPLPVFYTQGFGNSRLGMQTNIFSGFVQDDIKVKPNLLIKLGLRYDSLRVFTVPRNAGNFAPRIGFSYRPENFTNLNIRGAYGLFFSLPPLGPVGGAQLSSSRQLTLSVLQFPFSILPFTLPGRRFPESNTVPPLIRALSVPQLGRDLSVQPNLRNSYTQQANFGFDYFLKPQTVVAVTYNFVRGIKLLGPRDINSIVRPIFGNPVNNARFGRNDPTRGSVTQFQSAFDSYYHGLTLSLEQRLSARLNFLATYTLSKAIDNIADLDPNSIEFGSPLQPGLERSLSMQDIRHRLVVSGTWDLKYTKNPLLRDFQISSIITVTSGRPYNLLAGVDLDGSGDSPPADRPRGLGRNAGVSPAFANVDFRLTRQFKLTEKIRLSSFVEFFNLFNRVNIENFNRVFLPDAQGRFNLPRQSDGRFVVTADRFRSAFAPRQIQFGLRFNF